MHNKIVRFYPYLSALRGFAIILVVLVHSAQVGDNNLYGIFGHGARGVQLFFLLSSLSLFLSYEQRIKFENKPTVNFFIRRMSKILPLYYFIMILYLIYYFLIKRLPEYSFTQILSNFSFLNSLNSQWFTASIVKGGWATVNEVYFYLLFPLLWKYIKNFSSAIGIFILTLFASRLTYVYLLNKGLLENPINLYSFQLSLINQLPVFILGIILFFLLKAKIVSSKKNITKATAFLLVIFFITLSGLFILKDISDIILWSLSFCSLIIGLNLYPFKLFVNRLTVFLGKVSFGIYLTHFIVLDTMNKLHLVNFSDNGLISFICRFSIIIIISSIISYLLNRFIETKGQKVGNKVILKLNNK